MKRAEDSAPPGGVRWASEHHYRMLGTQVCVRVEPVAGAGIVTRLLAPFRLPTAQGAEHRYSLTSLALHRDNALLLRSDWWPDLVDGLLGDLNRVAVTGFRGFAVHAGVVAREGVVMAFPGVSDSGKSTLTAACLAAGFQYVSDEALCIGFDRDAVVPYPKPLKLSRHAAALAGLGWAPDQQEEMAVVPEDLGASVAVGPLRLGHVVQFVRRPGRPELHSLDRSETVATLLAMSFNHYRNPLDCFSLACRLALGARVWRLEYDDARRGASLLRELPGN